MLMVNVLMTSTTMELLPLLCLCLLTRCGSTFADGNRPSVLVAVEEGSDAILPCSLSTKENIDEKVFDWKKEGQKEVFLYASGSYYGNGRTGQDEQFKGRVFHFEDELKNGNASIKIKNTKMADNGSYTCIFPGQQTSHVMLFVGAASKPNVVTLNLTREWALLQCEVQGNPIPTVEWKDSAGNVIPVKQPQFAERGGRIYVTLQTNVTKTDHYHCVATQKGIRHRIHTETFVLIIGATPAPFVTGETSSKVTIGVVVGVVGILIGLVGIAVGVYVARSRRANGAKVMEKMLMNTQDSAETQRQGAVVATNKENLQGE